ncbi:helix-turn-helix domain-containing protein [Streptomyces roseolus]|uniref:helix-turn-helix domain-containing protein n=1 Tax=Streptomyces roseolus TaxID=67358 RepID=UPI00379970EE
MRESAPPPSTTHYAEAIPGRLKTLMERTGTGSPVTSRELAERAGVSHGTIGALMSGSQQTVPEPKAKAIAAVLGVDTLVVWAPVERSTTARLSRQVTT